MFRFGKFHLNTYKSKQIKIGKTTKLNIQMQFQCGNSNEPEVVRRWEHLKFYYAHKGGSGGWPNYTQAHIEYKTIYRQLIQSEEAIWKIFLKYARQCPAPYVNVWAHTSPSHTYHTCLLALSPSLSVSVCS